jgi:hypothetical protein
MIELIDPDSQTPKLRFGQTSIPDPKQPGSLKTCLKKFSALATTEDDSSTSYQSLADGIIGELRVCQEAKRNKDRDTENKYFASRALQLCSIFLLAKSTFLFLTRTRCKFCPALVNIIHSISSSKPNVTPSSSSSSSETPSISAGAFHVRFLQFPAKFDTCFTVKPASLASSPFS